MEEINMEEIYEFLDNYDDEYQNLYKTILFKDIKDSPELLKEKIKENIKLFLEVNDLYKDWKFDTLGMINLFFEYYDYKYLPNKSFGELEELKNNIGEKIKECCNWEYAHVVLGSKKSRIEDAISDKKIIRQIVIEMQKMIILNLEYCHQIKYDIFKVLGLINT